jgi:hypothetical protein
VQERVELYDGARSRCRRLYIGERPRRPRPETARERRRDGGVAGRVPHTRARPGGVIDLCGARRARDTITPAFDAREIRGSENTRAR